MLDLILLCILAVVVLWAARRGFFATVLRLGAWLVSIAVAQVLSQMLAPTIYGAFVAAPARRMIESNLDQAIDGSQAAQYAQQVIAELPGAVAQLARRVGGVEPAVLIENLNDQRFTTQNAAYLLEQSIIAPIGVAVIRLLLSLVIFVALLFVARIICRKLESVRELPVLRQADGLLGAALGLVKGVLLLVVLSLVLQAAAALGQYDSAFAQAVDASRVVALLSWF